MRLALYGSGGHVGTRVLCKRSVVGLLLHCISLGQDRPLLTLTCCHVVPSPTLQQCGMRLYKAKAAYATGFV